MVMNPRVLKLRGWEHLLVRMVVKVALPSSICSVMLCNFVLVHLFDVFHLVHVFHALEVLPTYFVFSHPGWQDSTIFFKVPLINFRNLSYTFLIR